MEMNRKPVNGLSLEFCTQLQSALATLEKDPAMRGLILTSVSSFCLSKALLPRRI